MKGMTVELVASSWIDVLGGLSRWYILRTPPLFWANATPLEHIKAAATPPSKTIRRISYSLPWRATCRAAASLKVYLAGARASRPASWLGARHSVALISPWLQHEQCATGWRAPNKDHAACRC